MPTPEHPVPDARDVWITFALHPLRLEAPLGWHPFISDWADQSGRVRYETLTGTPLDLNWLWAKAASADLGEAGRRRLDVAWKKESEAAEKQARTAGREFRWTGDTCSPNAYAGLAAEGTVREYLWDGLPGALAVLSFASRGRRVFLSIACCPPASCPAPARDLKRVLRSLKLAGDDEPFRIATPGLQLELPPEFRVTGVRGREGHFYLDAEAPGRRAGLARLGFSEWHLAAGRLDKVYASLAKILFDRSEPRDPVSTTVASRSGSGGLWDRKEERDPAPTGTAVREHAAALFREERWFHVRAGDWLVRKLIRKWAGGAAVLAWHCPETHALFALSARCGAGDAEALARQVAGCVNCHGLPGPGTVDWSAYTAEEARARQGDPEAQTVADKPDAKQDPAALRRRQLRFRVRTLPEVRLEVSSKDGTGDLVYEAVAPDGLLARVLRAGAKPAPAYRRLALDALGRRTWEGLAGAPSVGELLAVLSREFAAHPVEMFPKLLAFLKMLGERRLVEAAGDPEPEGAAHKTPSEEG